MYTNSSYQKQKGYQYVESLIKCQGRKVCTNLANTLDVSHDSIYSEFKNSDEQRQNILDALTNIVRDNLDLDNLILLFDDTKISKMYAKEIEGLEVSFDGSSGRPELGLNMVTALLTSEKVNIPINAMPYHSKQLVGDKYKSKTSIGIDIIENVTKSFKLKRILADAHYATKEMITYLDQNKLAYLMKIPCNRIAKIGDSNGQLKNIFRLKKNNRIKSIKGNYNGIDCFFYVVKIKDGTIMYLISNDQIDPYEVVDLYRIRWKIELFHRTAKQYLGLSDCQMRTIEKQHQHVLFVMLAYAITSVKRKQMGLSCVEDVINHIRNVKIRTRVHPILALKGNLC